MATWDDLALGTWDQLWTWDEPDRDIAIDAAYASGEVVLDAAELTIDWAGDVPTDAISPTLARDEFPILVAATDSYNRTVTAGVGSTDNGVQYTTAGGSASDFNVTGDRLAITMGSLSVGRRVQLPIQALHFDITIRMEIDAVLTGTGGQMTQMIRGRFQDTNNFVGAIVWRNVNGGNCTVSVFQKVANVDTSSSFPNVPNSSINSDVWLRFVAQGSTLFGYAWVDGDQPPTSPSVTLTGVTWLNSGTIEFEHSLNNSITNSLPVFAVQDELTILDRDMAQTSVGSHPWAGWVGTAMEKFSVDPAGYAVLRPIANNTVYIALVNDIAEVDFDILAKVRAPSLFTGGRGTFLLVARFQDTSNYIRLRLDFNTDQVMGYAFDSVSGGVVTVVSSGLFSDLFHYADRWIRFRAQGIGSSIRIKAWMDDDRINRDWTAYFTDTVFGSTAGKSGWGGYLLSTNTNTLPMDAFQVDQYWQGANAALDVGQISVGLSLDDGLPSGVTNTSNIGVNEAGAALLGPIETSPDIYFSTFRTDMPFGDIDRDVAGVAITAQVLSANGLRGVRVFTGRMADIPLDDQSAKLQAISSARLALSAPVQPPAVHGFYEGKEATWLIGYILFAAQLYVAPRPTEGCRLYLPLNGTTHPYIPATNSGAAAISNINFTALGVGGYVPPAWIDGPFTAAPDLCLNETAVRKLTNGPGTLAYSSFASGEDFLSQTGWRGRIECWVKGDPTNAAGSLNPSQGDLVMLRLRNPSLSRYAALLITSDRQIRGQIADGVGAVAFRHIDLPTDGRWHFVGLQWDIAASGGGVSVIMDNQAVFYGTGVSNSNLPIRDDLDRADLNIAIPTCEVRFTSGINATKAKWANATNFSPDVIMRRSLLDLEAVAEPNPREGFEILTSLAQAELAQVGFDEQDRVLYLPLSFWAESGQQVIEEYLSTDSNLGKKFKPSRDVHKIFNQITLSYKQSYVNETWVTGFQTSQLVRLIPGQSIDMVCALNAPAIEMRTLTFSVLSGTALAAAPPSVSNAINYITMNTATDGSGTYATSSDITVSIPSWNPGSVTVRIQNNSPYILYLANNVSIPPLGIGVKALVVADASVTAENSASIAKRGIRNLPVSLPAIQSAENAGTIAAALAGFLAYPRTTLVSDVWGDFRRKPGTLVRITDAGNTGLADSFRLTGITTVQDGANVQQAISAVQAWPVQTWGSGTWGSGIWGAS